MRKWKFSKDVMIKSWEKVVLMYQEARKKPTIKIVSRILWEVFKILIRVLMGKVVSWILDKI